MSKIDSYVVFDFETGGLKHTHSPATEIGMLTLHPDGLEETSRFDTIIKSEVILVEDNFKADQPDNVYEGGYYYKGALGVTGITVDQIKKQGMDVKKVAQAMAEQFLKAKLSKGHWSKPILVGHNLAFDVPFLQTIFDIAKIDLSKLVQGVNDHKGNWFPLIKDTMYYAKQRWPQADNYKLGNCCSMSGAEIVDAHRAMNDVVATGQLFSYFIKSMRSEVAGGKQQKEQEKARATFEM